MVLDENGPYFALLMMYFTEFGRALCVTVVDKPITMDNLRLLSSSKYLQRDRATLTV